MIAECCCTIRMARYYCCLLLQLCDADVSFDIATHASLAGEPQGRVAPLTEEVHTGKLFPGRLDRSCVLYKFAHNYGFPLLLICVASKLCMHDDLSFVK